MGKYKLTNKAVEGLSRIWDYTFDKWSAGIIHGWLISPDDATNSITAPSTEIISFAATFDQLSWIALESPLKR